MLENNNETNLNNDEITDTENIEAEEIFEVEEDINADNSKIPAMRKKAIFTSVIEYAEIFVFAIAFVILIFSFVFQVLIIELIL